MNRQQLVDAVGERLGDRKTAAVAVEAVLGALTTAMADGERVALFGFGVFEKVDRAARTARNPATGGTVEVPATSVPRFRPGQALKDAVNGRPAGAGRPARAATGTTADDRAGSGTAARSADEAETATKAEGSKGTPAKSGDTKGKDSKGGDSKGKSAKGKDSKAKETAKDSKAKATKAGATGPKDKAKAKGDTKSRSKGAKAK